jgi:hypothetical protein
VVDDHAIVEADLKPVEAGLKLISSQAGLRQSRKYGYIGQTQKTASEIDTLPSIFPPVLLLHSDGTLRRME